MVTSSIERQDREANPMANEQTVARHRVLAHTDHGTPWYFREHYPIGVEDLRDTVRHFADTAVDTFSFDAAKWACWYDTRVGERFGAIGPPFRDAFDLVQWRSLNQLIADGWDPPRVFADEAHALGMRCVASIRMNDGHLEPINRGYATMPKATRWYLSHPEYRNQAFESSVPAERRHAHMRMALDYSHEGVRQQRLEIIEELATNYDLDGIELNFMRTPWIFPPTQGPTLAPVLVEFVERARDALDRAAAARGRDHLELGMRVPEAVDRCLALGFDIAALAASGALDYLVPDAWRTIGLSTRVEEFKMLTGDACQVYVGIDAEGSQERPEAGGLIARYGKVYLPTSEMLRAAALNASLGGADGIAFFNSAGPTKWHLPIDHELWKSLGSRAEIESGARTYLYSGDEPSVNPDAENVEPALWDFRLLEELGTKTGTIRFRLIGGLPGDKLEIAVNDRVVTNWTETFLMGWDQGRTLADDPFRAPLPAHILFERTLAGVPLRPGVNRITFRLLESDPAVLRAKGDDVSPWARASTSISFVTEIAELEITVDAAQDRL